MRTQSGLFTDGGGGGGRGEEWEEGGDDIQHYLLIQHTFSSWEITFWLNVDTDGFGDKKMMGLWTRKYQAVSKTQTLHHGIVCQIVKIE